MRALSAMSTAKRLPLLLAIAATQWLVGTASPAFVRDLVKRQMRSAILGLPGGAVDTVESLQNLDQTIYCLAVIAGAAAGNTTTLTKHDLEDYVDEMGDVCSIVQGMVANWGDGCGLFFESLLEVEKYSTCIVARECSQQDSTPGVVLGACHARCKNEYGVAGEVTTECTEPTLMQTGLRHERACGDAIPAEVYFNFQNALEILLTFVGSMIFVVAEYAVSIVLKIGSKPPGVMNLVGSVYHALVVVHMVYFTVHTLGPAGDTCRFMMLATPFLYGPFVFSVMQVIPVAAAVEMVYDFSRSGGKKGGRAAVEKVYFSKCEIVLNVLNGVFVALIGGVCIMAGVFAMALIISACWGLVAYVHITLILVVFYGIIVLGFGCCYSWLMDGRMDVRIEEGDIRMLNIGFGFLVLLAVSWLVLVQLNSFLLYITGDYMPFHTSFFSEFGVGLPSWPTLNLAPLSEAFWTVVGRILSFDMDLLPEQIFEASLIVKGLTFVLGVIEHMITMACNKLRSDGEQKGADDALP